ncbi:MAG: hypothetical protein EON96_16925 [Caulobacteraceae bacterium]|nr:MAG: hypothetical protein EON96_16925 [Caulobacteraceae bacterium]
MRSHFALVCIAVLALAACDKSRKAASASNETQPQGLPGDSAVAAPRGFTHEDKIDVAGHFLPREAVQVGAFKLTHMIAGQPSDFQDWERGQRTAGLAPLVIEFQDVNSPLQTTEVGEQKPTVIIRVLPSAYHLTKAAVAFHGQDASLGPVTFAGAFNQKALAQARASGQGREASVLKGDLQVGDRRFRDVAFGYSVGD